ncbi:MAG: UvrD-helicase domain-containing protein [Acidobacteriota bacterium]
MSAPSRPVTELADAEARRRIVEDLDDTFFVEAAAGTGKTTALVSRLVALVLAGKAELDRVVAVTFTEKAAGEMRLRLRGALEDERQRLPREDEGRVRIERALEQLELARIGTLHGFCSDLLHERPVEAGVDPLFEVCDEGEARRLRQQAFEAWFQQALTDEGEGSRRGARKKEPRRPGLVRMLRRRPARRDAPGPREKLMQAVDALAEHRDFTTPWSRPDGFDRAVEVEQAFKSLEELAELANKAESEEDWLAKNLQEIGDFLVESRRLRAAGDIDGMEAELRRLVKSKRTHWHWKGRGKWFGGGLSREEVIAQRNIAKAELESLFDRADADLAALLQAELREVVESYEELKRRAGRVDFVDLLLYTRRLLQEQPAVREELSARFSHFFIDEFQDTDPLQAEILLRLASDDHQADWRDLEPVRGKLFLVGDPKQSIYRFRRADVALYEVLKQRLMGLGAELLHLTTSFRSVPALQSLVNASFAPVLTGAADGTQAEYVPLSPVRDDPTDRPSVVALPVPAPYGDYGKMVDWRIEESFPKAVGAWVDWLLKDSGWTLPDPESGEQVRIEARHVCLLFRRFRSFRSDATRPYVRELEKRRIPHVQIGGHSFHDREEVLALRNALCAIEWPDDHLRVYATLHGPFFGIGDDVLLDFHQNVGRLHPLRRLEDEDLTDDQRSVADALEVLGRLHRKRNRRPIAETLHRFLALTRAHAALAIWPTGEQALANCLRVIDLARRFERQGATSFRGFVEMLEEDSDRGGIADAPVVEEGTEGVRIMTAHAAKGLEFPVLILVDPTCKEARDTPSRHVDARTGVWAEPLCDCAPTELSDHRELEWNRDVAEAKRLTYVAATRARDILVLPVLGDEEPWGGKRPAGWLTVLDPAVYPADVDRRSGHEAPGCPEFGMDSVPDRPDNAKVSPHDAVMPGLHRPRAGDHSVVWWDPAVLELSVGEQVGLRQQVILQADESGQAEAGARAHEEWQDLRQLRLDNGLQATQVVTKVTELAEHAMTSVEKVTFEEVIGRREDRPGGARFGTLVHAILETEEPGARLKEIEAAAAHQGRLLGATEEEIASASEVASGVLSHPLMQRAAESKDLRRECPVQWPAGDGSLAEGVIDMVFKEADGSWTVVDYKTDRDLEAGRDKHARQVGLYCEALALATGAEVRGVVLMA